ncbi:MAG: transcription-repair coupling factor [Bacilli bacterium]|nr:transcription-repair coupling factor [Bacilli bacterium]
MLNSFFKYDNNLTISGLNASLINEYILNYFYNNDKNILIVSDSLYDANKLYKSMYKLCSNTYFFPMDEFATALAISASPDLKIIRINTLNSIDKDKSIVITNLTGYIKYIDKKVNSLKLDFNIKRKELIDFLENNHYVKTNLVTTTGEYAVRNYIVDFFPLNSESPIRVEFFGDDIESIRLFNYETQISNESINDIDVYSFSDEVCADKENIVNKLDDPMVFFIDYKKTLTSYNSFLSSKSEFNLLNIEDIFNDFYSININNQIFINTLEDVPIKNEIISYKSQDIINFNNDFSKLETYVKEHVNNYYVIFMVTNENLINKLISIFGNNISFKDVIKGRVNIVKRNIDNGYIFEDYIVISEFDIENIVKKSLFVNKYNIGRKIKGFEDLKKGDYVVHVSHGIGVYEGLVTLENNGIKKDYLLINYAGNDKIYVPAQKIETIYKYGDSDVSTPKLNSLSNNLWAKTKIKTRERIKDISSELIKLYAEREVVSGDIYDEFAEEVIFAKDFEYEETLDQKKCIKEILEDLSKSKPMDRLLCGDVGFGKTEVAMRAMFRTVMNNRQVAYLCPTTILSKQQYESCLKRFRHFPVNIELVNRFTSYKDLERIKEGLKKGIIDIVIGTHKILNKDISFKQLGLLVIDEEQRFGVSQKEKIKQLKTNVNVLTLSATPIPRTLKLAMSGVKDLSIIDTAPINRYPVQTYVIEENDYLIKEAIYKELSRDGQVYILHNNIEALDNEFTRIKYLVPEAKICIAHGKMEKEVLNERINSFITGEYNVLLCTTIIETGIDIPNVNTLIIKNADKFGLSQLYQIRGRVGRSDKIAYAYMMYEKNKMLNDIAIKRLKTIKDFTELGSGYKIAMRDLSIRGAGELLGSIQSGFVSSVGIDLYMDMVNEEIAKIKGIEVEKNNEDNNNFLNITTSISEDYVDDESLRLEIHKLINEISSKESFEKVKNEIQDRFGKLNDDIIYYMYEEWFQNEADSLNIKNVKYLNKYVEIEFPEEVSNKVDGEKLFLQIYSINPKFSLKYFDKKLIISLNIVNRKNDYVKDLLDLLLLIKTCIKNI